MSTSFGHHPPTISNRRGRHANKELRPWVKDRAGPLTATEWNVFKFCLNDQRGLTAIACMDMFVCCYDRWHGEKCIQHRNRCAWPLAICSPLRHVTRGWPFISLDWLKSARISFMLNICLLSAGIKSLQMGLTCAASRVAAGNIKWNLTSQKHNDSEH